MASHPKRAHMDNVPDTPDQTESSSENDSASDDESNDLEREIQVRTESIMTQLWKNISLRLRGVTIGGAWGYVPHHFLVVDNKVPNHFLKKGLMGAPPIFHTL